MNLNLFKLALDRLEASDWAHFERLSSVFLAQEFQALRTMANPSGDGGRDSELYSPNEAPIIAIQYSVTTLWRRKIRATVARIKEAHPAIRIIIYMTSQTIGGLGDDLKKEVLKLGISLDIRDRNWFFERACSDAAREAAVEEIVDRIARPYLVGESIIDKPISPLSTSESRAALLYLGLQWQDDNSDKGLTKLSFDALVRAALRKTTSDSRLSRQAVLDSVCKSLPEADHQMVKTFVDSALIRLSKRYIRHWPKEDEFCLTHEESQRIQLRLAEEAVQQAEYNAMIRRHCEACLNDIGAFVESNCADLQSRVPRVTEKYLLRRGEGFVAAAIADRLDRLGYEQLDDIILADINAHRPPPAVIHICQKVVSSIIRAIFSRQDQCMQPYLRRLAASYTLLSFLNQTPDVQAATRKLFSHGTIWIDTTVLLPLIAEQLDEEQTEKPFSKLFESCKKIGVELRVTTGVIQEVNAHMNMALTCSRNVHWQGRVPFLFFQYLQLGLLPADFGVWLSRFRGSERPDDDLAQYLAEVFSIKNKDLGDAHIGVDKDLRFAAERLWSEAHSARRSHAHNHDDAKTRILIKHYIETYLGVIALRKTEDVTELGYRHWLLTLDSIAWSIRDQLREEFKDQVPPSPLMSLSYLSDCITFGSGRVGVGKTNEMSLPVILDVEMSESMPHDFLELAAEVRKKHAGLPDYAIRRTVRDEIDKARRRRGCLGHQEKSKP